MSIKLKDTITDSIDKLDGQHSSYFAHTIKVGTSTTEYNSTNSIITLPAYPTIPTIPTTLPNPKSLSWSGAASGSYDGSTTASFTIPTVPTSLKNPNSLKINLNGNTITYDGSSEKTITINTNAGNYLPLSGGTITGSNDTPLYISGASTGSYVSYWYDTTYFGSIGVLSNRQPYFYSDKGYKIWHEGNFNPSNYLSLSGGDIDGNLSAKQYSVTQNLLSGVSSYTSSNPYTFTGTNTDSYKYITSWTCSLDEGSSYLVMCNSNYNWCGHDKQGFTGYVSFWLRHSDNSTHILCSTHQNSTKGCWGIVAPKTGVYHVRLNTYKSGDTPQFYDIKIYKVPVPETTNTVGWATGAEKLTIPRTIWGQSFDGTENIDGILTINAIPQSLCINHTSATTGWNDFIKCLNPYLTTTNHTAHLTFGYKYTAKNVGYIGFKYAGDGSTNNIITLGLHSVDNILNINGSGNVGIGTMEPESKFHVLGNSKLDGQNYITSFSPNYLDSWSDGTNSHPWYGYDHRYGNTGIFSTTISDYYGMYFRTAYATLCMTQDGNVGIGTNSPTQKLHVNGTIQTGSILFTGTIGSNTGTYVVGSGTDGLFIAANESGKKVFLESTNQTAPYFRNSAGDHTIYHSGNLTNVVRMGSYNEFTTGISLGDISKSGTYKWNDIRYASLKLVNWNNCISFIIGGTNNNRQAIIQAGHASESYSEHLSTLYLNKFGGEVYIGTNVALHSGNWSSYISTGGGSSFNGVWEGTLMVNGSNSRGSYPSVRWHIPNVNWAQFIMNGSGELELRGGASQDAGYATLRTGWCCCTGLQINGESITFTT